MKLLACFAAVAIIPLASCSANPPSTMAAAPPPNGTIYCWKGRLTGTDRLECNWEGDRRAACESNGFVAVDAANFSEPKPAGMCSNGQWLVMVQPK